MSQPDDLIAAPCEGASLNLTGAQGAKVPTDAKGAKIAKRKRWTLKGGLCFSAFVLAVGYLFVPMLAHTSLYTEVLFHPSPYDKANYQNMDTVIGRPHEEYFFTNSDGNKLNGFLWRAPGSKKVVLYHHGNAGTVAHRASSTAAIMINKASVFIYDYRGFGKSEGKPSVAGILDDGLSAYDLLVNKLHFDPKDIINYGESLGAGPACEVAFKHPTGGLILQSGISSLPEVGRAHFCFLEPYPDWILPQPTLNNVEKIKSIHVPVAIIHGGLDTTIPPALAQHVFNNANEPKKFFLLADSNHNDVHSKRDLEQYLQGIRFALCQAPGQSP